MISLEIHHMEGLANIICYYRRWLNGGGMENFKALLSPLGGS